MFKVHRDTYTHFVPKYALFSKSVFFLNHLEEELMMIHRVRILCFFVLLLLLAACGNNTSHGNEQIESDVVERDGFPVTITDSVGREVTIENEPETIISVQASTTEILFAIGVGDKVIGVSDYCNYPEEVEAIQKVGAQNMNAELILSLQPDLIFVTDYHYNIFEPILQQFEEAGITVVVTKSAESFAGVYETIEMIGQATGAADEAKAVIADMNERIEQIREKAANEVTEKKRVWVELSPAPDIFTTGKGTFMHEMLETIQAINVAGDLEGWVKLTEEEIVQLDPDVIITTYGYYVDTPSEDILKRAGWEEVPAIKNKQVFDVDNDTVTRPGPRLVEGVETLAEFIYPEVFSE